MPNNDEFLPFKVIGKPIQKSEIEYDDPDEPENKKRLDEKEKYFDEHPDEIPDL